MMKPPELIRANRVPAVSYSELNLAGANIRVQSVLGKRTPEFPTSITIDEIVDSERDDQRQQRGPGKRSANTPNSKAAIPRTANVADFEGHSNT
jgi:hypothetical protein